ncbi:hypothetical protein 1 [Hubei picorna-like virus 77]|uniref:hypothetical protein 1 n=1 Tax=Hubei picorna-like virus 77 TaxID=1923161 RepID=UPI00090A8385|nr:hypothetical protein 1 [Hubei picorna-like virus 77]APG78408.1 hypothetical protein 1 [Hubei picorna-like virus 77]
MALRRNNYNTFRKSLQTGWDSCMIPQNYPNGIYIPNNSDIPIKISNNPKILDPVQIVLNDQCGFCLAKDCPCYLIQKGNAGFAHLIHLVERGFIFKPCCLYEIWRKQPKFLVALYEYKIAYSQPFLVVNNNELCILPSTCSCPLTNHEANFLVHPVDVYESDSESDLELDDDIPLNHAVEYFTLPYSSFTDTDSLPDDFPDETYEFIISDNAISLFNGNCPLREHSHTPVYTANEVGLFFLVQFPDISKIYLLTDTPETQHIRQCLLFGYHQIAGPYPPIIPDAPEVRMGVPPSYFKPSDVRDDLVSIIETHYPIVMRNDENDVQYMEDHILSVFKSLKLGNTLYHLFQLARNDATAGTVLARLYLLFELHGFHVTDEGLITRSIAAITNAVRTILSLPCLKSLHKFFQHEDPLPLLHNDSVDDVKNFLNFTTDSDLSAPDIVKAVAAVVTAFISIAGVTLCPTNISQWMTKAGFMAKSVSFMKNGVSDLFTLISSAFGSFTDTDLSNQNIRDLVNKTEKLHDDLVILRNHIAVNLNEVVSSPEIINRLRTKYEEIYKHYVTMTNSGVKLNGTKNLLQTISTTLTQIEDLKHAIQNSTIGKMEPVVWWLYGGTGVGKSRAAGLITEELEKILGRKLTTFTRKPTEKYWSGYCGQDVVIYDDGGQNKLNLDHDEWNNIYTPQAYPLPMADLPNKGLNFTSPFVFICSNYSLFTQSQSLVDPTILNRRRDGVWEVKYEPSEYQFMLDNPGTHDPNKVDFMEMYRMPRPSNATQLTIKPAQEGLHGRAIYRQLAENLMPLYRSRVKVYQDKIKSLNLSPLTTVLKNNAFDFIRSRDHSSYPCYLLLGAPGTRKTSLAKDAGFTDTRLSDFEATSPLYDDVAETDEKFTQFISNVTHRYNTAISTTVYTANETPFWKRFNQLDEEQRVATMRKLTLIEFQYRTKFCGLVKYNHDDLAKSGKSYEKFVTIESASKKYMYETLVKELVDSRETKVEYSTLTKIPTLPTFDAEFEVRLDAPLETFLDDPSRMLTHSTFVRGSYIKMITHFTPVLNAITNQVPKIDRGDIITALTSFNMLKVKCPNVVTVIVHDPNTSYGFNFNKKASFCFFVQADVSWRLDNGKLYQVIGDQSFETEDRSYVDFYTQFVLPVMEPSPADTLSPFSDLVPSNVKGIITCLKLVFEVLCVGASVYVLNHDSKVEMANEAGSDVSGGTSFNPLRVGNHPHFNYDLPALDEITMASDYTEANRIKKPLNNDIAVDPQASDLLENIIPKQMGHIVNAQGIHLVHCIMIHGNVGVTIGHMSEETRSTSKLFYNNKTWKIKYGDRLVARDGIKFTIDDKTFPSVKSILPHLRPTQASRDYNSKSAVLCVPSNNRNFIHHVVRVKSAGVVTRTDMKKFTDLLYVAGPAGYSLTPCLSTKSGDCGAPVVLLDSSDQHKFLGFHAASNDAIGQITSLFATDFALCNNVADIVVLPHQCVVQERAADVQGLTYFGRAKTLQGANYRAHRNVNTQFRHSPLAKDEYSVEAEPSILSHKDSRNVQNISVYERGVFKWGHKQPQIDEKTMDLCGDEIADFLVHTLKMHHSPDLGVLTTTEAINRCTRFQTSNPIQKQTSVGFPWKTLPLVATKMDLLELGSDGLSRIAPTEHGQKLRTAVKDLIDNARNGKRSAVVFDVSLKDEVLPFRKIYDVANTRTFAGAPLDYTIAHRKYFHAVFCAIQDCRHALPYKVGINTTSMEWGGLYNYLAEMSDVGFDLDYKSFDSTIPLSVTKQPPRIYNKIYQALDPNWKPEDDIIRTNLHSVLHGPLLTFYDHIVQAPGGQVSGQPGTTIDNTTYHLLYLLYSYKMIVRRAKQLDPQGASWLEETLEFLLRFVRMALYGDDGAYTVKKELLPYFNFETVKDELSKLYVQCTPALKTTAGGVMKLSSMTFLKQSFVYFKTYNLIISRLDIDSVKKQIQWCRVFKAKLYDDIKDIVEYDPLVLAQSIDSLMRNSIGHGPAFYDILRNHVTEICVTRGIPISPIPDWHTNLAICYLGSLV